VYDKRIECGGSVNQDCAHAVTRNADTILAKDKSMNLQNSPVSLEMCREERQVQERLASQH